MPIDAIVLLPTYNERENVAIVVPRILAHPGFRVIVIDDASPDGTGVAADGLSREYPGRVQVMHRPGKAGLGRAYVAGMREALSQRPDFICQMDADGSHDTNDLPRLVAAASDCDLIIGSRYVKGGALVDWPWHRVALSRAANAYMRAVTGVSVRDCTAGFRCWRPRMLERIGLEELQADGYAFQVETLVRTLASGGRVVEVPIAFRVREFGSSKMSGRIMLEAALLPWRIRRRQGPAPGVVIPHSGPSQQQRP